MGLKHVQRAPETERPDMLAFKAVCRRLGIHYNTGYKLLHEGGFPVDVVEIGGRYFVRTADLEDYAACWMPAVVK